MLLGLNLLKNRQKQEDFDIPAGPYSEGGVEPDLQDLLNDPIIQMMAKSDNIEPEKLAGCVQNMRKKFGSKH